MVPPLSEEVVASKRKKERGRISPVREKTLVVSPGYGRECVYLGGGVDGAGTGRVPAH